MLRDEDAFGDDVVGRSGEGAAMLELHDAVEAVARHIVAADEDGLRLCLGPAVETLVVELLGLVIDVGVLIGNVTVDYAAFGDGYFGIVKH